MLRLVDLPAFGMGCDLSHLITRWMVYFYMLNMEDKYAEVKEYNKLVRDKTIEHIQSQWKKAIFHIASEEEKFPKAFEKLREELEELKEAINVDDQNNIYSESADVLEIKNLIHEKFTGVMSQDDREELINVTRYLEKIVLQCNLDISKIFTIKEEKLEKKWWFSKRIILERS